MEVISYCVIYSMRVHMTQITYNINDSIILEKKSFPVFRG
jgi:hypothetical protein